VILPLDLVILPMFHTVICLTLNFRKIAVFEIDNLNILEILLNFKFCRKY
jgi:hypothetical protein